MGLSCMPARLLPAPPVGQTWSRTMPLVSITSSSRRGYAAAHDRSACNSGKLSGSKVLHALGVAPELASSALRFSLGKDSRAEQVDVLLDRLPAIVERVRAHWGGVTS